MDYAQVVDEYGLEELPAEIVRKVERSVHPFMARCDGIAVGGCHLLINGGNFDYYAGLEYEEPALAGRGWTLYEASSEEDCRVSDLLNTIRESEKVPA